MFSTIVIILLVLLAVGIFLFGRASKRGAVADAEEHNARVREAQQARGYTNLEEKDPRPFEHYLPPAVALVPLVLALIMLAFTTITTVEAKQQGVLLTFGKPADRTLDPGLNMKLPWQKVVTVDTTRQTDNFNDGKQDTDHSVIKVRLGNGNVSALYASITWKVNDEAANTIYGDFRADDPTEQVYKNLVAPNFKQAVNSTLGGYNPIADIKAPSKDGAAGPETAANVNFAPNFDQFAADIKASFEKRVTPADGSEPLIQVIAVQASFIDFDDATEQQIKDYQAEVQKTINAQQAVQTAIQQAAANEKIAASISKDPNVLASRCLDLIAEGKFDPPIGFSCYPGGSGQSTGVIVNSNK